MTQDWLVVADNHLGIQLLVTTKGGAQMVTATSPTPDSALEPAPVGTQELMTAVRSLFTCTRKARSGCADAGATTVLGVVADHGEAKVSTVAAVLLMDVSTVSRTLSALC